MSLTKSQIERFLSRGIVTLKDRHENTAASVAIFAASGIPVRPVVRVPTIRYASFAERDFVAQVASIPEEPSRDTETAS